MEKPDLGHLLHRAARQLRGRLGASLGRLGLTAQQAGVLMAFAMRDAEVLTPLSIADAIDADAATTTGLLARLVRDGWLEQCANPSDGRSKLFSPTDAAAAAMPAIFDAAEGVSTSALSALSDEEATMLVSLLARLVDRPDPSGAGLTR